MQLKSNNYDGMTNEVLTVITPVYNDWESFRQLVNNINTIATQLNIMITIMAINDFSERVDFPDSLEHLDFIKQIEIVNLLSNVGHQRAIALGLVTLYKDDYTGKIIVMDADGEDSPSAIETLYNLSIKNPDAIIVAQRGQRTERLWFQVFYKAYIGLFRLITNQDLRFGNFCLIPSKYLKNLAYNPNLWNHFAATIKSSKLPVLTSEIDRGYRYDGSSHMNFHSLVIHGLSAISIYIEHVTLRILFFSMIISFFIIGGVLSVFFIRIFTSLAIPGWATNVVGFLSSILLQMIIFSSVMIMFLLNARSSRRIIPAIDTNYLIESRKIIYERQV